MPTEKPHGFHTQVIQAGREYQPEGAIPAVPPIVPSVGYVHDSLSHTEAALGYEGGTPFAPSQYVYSRYGAPNQAQLEEALAVLEGAESAVSFSSGMAALHGAIMALVPPGGVLVASEQIYGTTRTLLNWLAINSGIHVHYSDFLDLEGTSDLIRRLHPSAAICEVLTNPLGRVIEIDALAQVAAETGASLLVDNTFATPYLLRPLDYGADCVVHSTTKYINGHGDVLGGVVVGPTSLMRQIYNQRNILGAMPGAFDAWLTLRGLRTLALRMKQACNSAQQVAAWLESQPQISRVYYPGLPGDPCHLAAVRLFRPGCFGSIIAFEIGDASRAETYRFVEQLRLIRPVTSLGDVYSLILHPASTSHRALSPEECAAQGITEGVLRLSVGIEDPEDLIADLWQALVAS